MSGQRCHNACNVSLNYAKFRLQNTWPSGYNVEDSIINNDLKVIGTTTIGLLENVTVVDDNHLIENIISIAQLDKSGAVIYDNYDKLVYKCILNEINSYHLPLSILTGIRLKQ